MLPLNSPEYYAPYNGAIEESQRDLKACLREKLIPDLLCSENHSPAVYAEVAAHDLNHRLRPCLRGKTSCQVYFSLGEKPAFSKMGRREIYDILMERVEWILTSMNQFEKSAREAAWRIAVEFWLQSRGFIKVHIPKKCHPILPPFFAHEWVGCTMLAYGAQEGVVQAFEPHGRGFSLHEALRTKQFWLVNVLSFCDLFLINVLVVHIVIHAIDIQLPPTRAAGVLSLAAGPVVAGILFDLTGKYPMASILCLIVSLIAFLSVWFLRPIRQDEK